MKYDFSVLPKRRSLPSIKWDKMLSEDPNVPEGVIPFTVADMELYNPPEVINGLKRYLDETVLGYTYANEDFKNAVSSWMSRRHNFEVSHDWMVMTSGVVMAFFAAVEAFSNEGDGVVIMPPVYPPFFLSAQRKNRKLIECPLINTNGYYEIDFDHFEEILRHDAPKVMIFCSPHNPIGRVWGKDELEKLASLCVRYNVLMVVDEIHHDIVMPGYKHTVMQTLSDEIADNCITCTSLSKTFNLAGMSLSIIFIKNPKIRMKFETELERNASHVISNLGFKAYEIAYNECEDWFEQFSELIDTNQKLVHAWTEGKKVKAPLIQGTYLQWLNFNELGMDNSSLVKFLHEKAYFYMNDGTMFGEKEGHCYQRLNLAAPTFVIKEALDRLDLALKDLC